VAGGRGEIKNGWPGNKRKGLGNEDRMKLNRKKAGNAKKGKRNEEVRESWEWVAHSHLQGFDPAE